MSVCLHFSLSTSHFRKLSAVDDFWLNIDFYPIPDIFEGQGLELVVLEEVIEVLSVFLSAFVSFCLLYLFMYLRIRN